MPISTVLHLDYRNRRSAIRGLPPQTGLAQAWIYGESYGARNSRSNMRCATPAPSAGVIIDNVVDLGLDADGYYSEDVFGWNACCSVSSESPDTVADCRF